RAPDIVEKLKGRGAENAPRPLQDLLYVGSRKGLALAEPGENLTDLFGRSRDHARAFKRATQAGHLLGQEELDIFLDARDDADVLALHVEEQRTRNRILACGDGLERRRDARHGGDLQRVAVLVVEAQAKDADGVRVGLQAG